MISLFLQKKSSLKRTILTHKTLWILRLIFDSLKKETCICLHTKEGESRISNCLTITPFPWTRMKEQRMHSPSFDLFILPVALQTWEVLIGQEACCNFWFTVCNLVAISDARRRWILFVLISGNIHFSRWTYNYNYSSDCIKTRK